MSPRSKGVMKERRTLSSTSRAMASASVLMRRRCGGRQRHAGAAFQKIAQGDGAVDQGAGMIVEEAEEFLFARHQGLEKAQHRRTPFWWLLLAMPPPAPSTGPDIKIIIYSNRLGAPEGPAPSHGEWLGFSRSVRQGEHEQHCSR